jgi:tRNA pseudouridine13 synthase
VTLPLIGFETNLGMGKEGEIEKAVLLEQNVGKDDFRIAANPDLGSRGARRAALLKVSPSIKVEGDCANLEFFLPKGSYATVLLREYTKGANAVAISETNKPED